MAESDNRLLAVAALLGAAAYIYATRDVSAAESDQSTATGTQLSGNGFAINNPLNIRYLARNAFNGQTGNHNGYGIYSSLSLGVRAAFLQLSQYVASGLDTVTAIVTKWAPPFNADGSVANNTDAYISDVSSRMGVDAAEPLSWPSDATDLIQAMAWHENGYNNMTDSDVESYIATA